MASSAMLLTLTLIAGLLCLNGVQTKNKCPPQFPLQSGGESGFCCSNKCPDGNVGRRCKIGGSDGSRGKGLKSCPDGQECYTDVGTEGICCQLDPCPSSPSVCPNVLKYCNSQTDCKESERCCTCMVRQKLAVSCIPR